MMNDLSVRNAIEKFTVFETGPGEKALTATSGSLYRRQKFSNYTARLLQFSPLESLSWRFPICTIRPQKNLFAPALFF